MNVIDTELCTPCKADSKQNLESVADRLIDYMYGCAIRVSPSAVVLLPSGSHEISFLGGEPPDRLALDLQTTEELVHRLARGEFLETSLEFDGLRVHHLAQRLQLELEGLHLHLKAV